MKKLLCFLSFIFFSEMLHSQFNLVPNSSFENYDTCKAYIQCAKFWSTPINTSPDYLNSCNTSTVFQTPSNMYGYQVPHSGTAYAHIITYTLSANPDFNNYREYVQTALIDTLQAGIDYCIRFYVSPADSMNYWSNDMGVYFSDTLIDIFNFPKPLNLPFTPQFINNSNNNLNDKNIWTEIAGNYIASGGEKYIIIGNFKDSAATIAHYTGWNPLPGKVYGSYFIDDILVSPCDSITGLLLSDKSEEEIVITQFISSQQLLIESRNELINQILIYSSLGQLVYKMQSVVSLCNVDLYTFSPGIYFVSILTNKKYYYKPFSKPY